MSLVLLIGPKQVDQIHWTVFVPLGLIIHITFNNMRNPGYKDRPDSVQENWVGEWIPAVRAPRHGGQAGGHRLSKNGHMSIHRWLNNWTWDGELLNLIFTWGFRRMNHMTHMAWVIQHQSLESTFRPKSVSFYHVQMWDQLSTCTCYHTCLKLINDWSDLNPRHFPLYEPVQISTVGIKRWSLVKGHIIWIV